MVVDRARLRIIRTTSLSSVILRWWWIERVELEKEGGERVRHVAYTEVVWWIWDTRCREVVIVDLGCWKAGGGGEPGSVGAGRRQQWWWW